MNGTCVVVADSRQARFYDAQPGNAPRVKLTLVERGALENPDPRDLGASVTGRPRTETNTNRQAGPVHPIAAQRGRHRLELERRFGREIARKAGEMTRGWSSGTVVLIAAPRLLGLVRAYVREVLDPGIDLKELAKDYGQLTAAELAERLAMDGPSTGPRATLQ